MSTGIEKMEAELDAGGNRGMQDFRYGLRKFRKDCKNFTTIEKISQSLRNFSMHLFRYNSKNYCAKRKFMISTQKVLF